MSDQHTKKVSIHVDGDITAITMQTLAGDQIKWLDNPAMTELVLDWIRHSTKENQMKLFAALVLEYQVAAHINDRTEREYLEDLTMDDRDIVRKIMETAVRVCERIPPENNGTDSLQVSVGAIHARLEQEHVYVPDWVVFTVLKTLEYIDGRVRDIEEGYFVLVKPPKMPT